MKDWKRYEEAQRLRDSGLTIKAVGEALGVGPTATRRMLVAIHRREITREVYGIDEHPKPPVPWTDGLDSGVAWTIRNLGFKSREDCKVFAVEQFDIPWSGDLTIPWALDPSGEIHMSRGEVNKIRAWLGVDRYSTVTPTQFEARLQTAKRLLERNGYVVNKPFDIP